MISAHTSPADLAARILQPLARSLEEARQHLDLEPIDEASTEGAIAARQDSLPAAPPAVAIPTPRQPPPSGPSASGQAIDGRAADGVPTSPSEALAAATACSPAEQGVSQAQTGDAVVVLSEEACEQTCPVYDMTLHPDALVMAEALVHETQHGKLHTLMRLDPVLVNGDTHWTSSPVRPRIGRLPISRH